jgi:hypothetical protein
MVERLEDMPEGTIGFRATGKLTREDYSEAMIPAIREAAAAGEMRSVFVIGPEFDGLEPGALVEDIKSGFDLTVAHHSAWKRTAIVSDVEWIRNGVRLFGWMTPGELKLFSLDQLDEAKSWAAA